MFPQKRLAKTKKELKIIIPIIYSSAISNLFLHVCHQEGEFNIGNKQYPIGLDVLFYWLSLDSEVLVA